MIPEHYPDTDDEQLFEAAMRGIIESLDDPYSRYLSPTQLHKADETVEGRFGGVGIQVRPVNGEALITGLIPGGAAEEASISSGNIIVKVNDTPAVDLTFQELVSAIRGKPGTTVDITLLDPETGEEKLFRLERTLLELAPVKWELLQDGIGFLRLQSFDAQSVAGIRQAWRDMNAERRVDALILDLRDNPGGLLEVAVLVADMFLEEGPIVSVKATKAGVIEEFRAEATTMVGTALPMAVLVDEGSASAAEILAGALQSHQRATVIGVNTVGKGSVDTLFGLPDGSGLALKVATYVAGKDMIIEGKGIEPDIISGELPPAPHRPDEKQVSEWIQKYVEAKSDQKERAFRFLKELTDEN